MATLRTFILATAIVGLATVAPVDSKEGGCGLFQYYDPHMNNCGPCREICDQMEAKRTEEKCRSQCSDYLVDATCTYRQYYDDNVQACAPCSEICDLSDRKGTTQDCASQCQNYLKALNCSEEEYFEEADKECAACSELCSQRDEHGNTSQECFRKCLKYTEKYSSLFAGNGDHHPGLAEAKTGPGNPSSLPSRDLGVMGAIIAISAVVIAVTVGVVVVYMKRHTLYTPANSDDGNVDDDQTEDNVDSAFNMDELTLPEPSLEQGAPASGLTIVQVDAQTEDSPTAVAVQEQNPHASARFCLHSPVRESVF